MEVSPIVVSTLVLMPVDLVNYSGCDSVIDPQDYVGGRFSLSVLAAIEDDLIMDDAMVHGSCGGSCFPHQYSWFIRLVFGWKAIKPIN